MQQKLMNVKVKCIVAYFIYANNTNGKFCMKYRISTFMPKGKAAKDKPLRRFFEVNSQEREPPGLMAALSPQKQHYSISSGLK